MLRRIEVLRTYTGQWEGPSYLSSVCYGAWMGLPVLTVEGGLSFFTEEGWALFQDPTLSSIAWHSLKLRDVSDIRVVEVPEESAVVLASDSYQAVLCLNTGG